MEEVPVFACPRSLHISVSSDSIFYAGPKKQTKSLTVLFAWLRTIVVGEILFGMNSEDMFSIQFWQQKSYLTMWQPLYPLATIQSLLLGTFITKGKGKKRNHRDTVQDFSPKCPVSLCLMWRVWQLCLPQEQYSPIDISVMMKIFYISALQSDKHWALALWLEWLRNWILFLLNCNKLKSELPHDQWLLYRIAQL